MLDRDVDWILTSSIQHPNLVRPKGAKLFLNNQKSAELQIIHLIYDQITSIVLGNEIRVFSSRKFIMKTEGSPVK